MPTNPRRANSHRRNTARARVLATETHCGICGQPVDVTLPHGLPNSPEIDEIIPISRGGSPYNRDNLRLTHRLCNARRGNKMDHHQPGIRGGGVTSFLANTSAKYTSLE